MNIYKLGDQQVFPWHYHNLLY